MEMWRPVTGWEDIYEVSNLGNVRRILAAPRAVVGRVLRGEIDKDGYHRVLLVRRSRIQKRMVNQMVCEAFHGPRPSSRHQAAHADRIRTNNRPENLRWALPVENSADAIAHGSLCRGTRHHSNRLSEAQVRAIRANAAKGMTQLELGELYGVSKVAIHKIITGKSWSWLT